MTRVRPLVVISLGELSISIVTATMVITRRRKWLRTPPVEAVLCAAPLPLNQSMVRSCGLRHVDSLFLRLRSEPTGWAYHHELCASKPCAMPSLSLTPFKTTVGRSKENNPPIHVTNTRMKVTDGLRIARDKVTPDHNYCFKTVHLDHVERARRHPPCVRFRSRQVSPRPIPVVAQT